MHALAAVPTGATPIADQGDAWQGYLTALADQAELANAEMVSAYDTMRDVFSSLDLPFVQTVADATGLGYATAWTKDLDQQFIDFNAMGQAIVGWLREAATGDRKVFLQGDRWALEQKDDDHFTIQLDTQSHLPYMAAPTTPGTTNGTLGIAPLLIGIGIIASAAVTGGYIYLVIKAISSARDVILGIIDYQRAKLAYECLSQHPQNPQECHKTTEAQIALTKAVNEGREKPTDKNPLEETVKGIGSLATTLLWVGFGGALLYLGVKVVPPMIDDWQSARSKRTAPA